MFLEIGGEGTLSGPPSGYVATLAKNYSALLISVEHRYYGQSMPTATVTADDLKLLTVEQALADLAAFTDYYKMTVPQANSAWFVFGGSYPGALASWYRHAYPEHSKGSLSSSGVVNCIVDYSGFDTQVAAATGNDCANNIRRVQSAFENTIQSSPAGFSSALSLFQCEKDMSHEDFYYMIADSWSMMVQYNSKTMLCSALDAGISDQSTDEQVMTLFSDLSNDYWGKDFCAQGFCKYLIIVFHAFVYIFSCLKLATFYSM